jgi:hypothetical protein
MLDPNLPPTPDRRHATRYSPAGAAPGYVAIAPGKTVGPVKVWNLSADGVCLICPQGFPVGSVVEVRLFHKGRQDWAEHPMEIRYVVALPGGEFVIGGKFVPQLGEEELWGFL